MNPEDEAEEDGANIDLDSQRKVKCVVLETSTRQVSNLFSAHQGHVFCCSFLCVYILYVVHFLNLYYFTSISSYQLGTCEMISVIIPC